jgi:hypothetical protein
MDALGDLKFGLLPPSRVILRRGGLVTFILPYATTLELVGRQKGIILSLDEHNRTNERPLICPIIYGENSVNETWGIRLKTNTALASYLRPDLASHIEMAYGQVTPVMGADKREPFIFPPAITKKAIQKLIEMIQPTPEKFAQKRRLEFLGYGEIGWAHGFPRSNMDRNDKVPVLNLTPPEIYQQTGMALLTRAHTHLEKYHPYYDIAVGAHAWFDTAFFPATEIRALPIGGTLARRIGWDPVSAGIRALKGFGKKTHGKLDDGARLQITTRYTTPIGQLPSHVLATQRHKQGKSPQCRP